MVTFDLLADLLLRIHPDANVLRVAIGQSEVLVLPQDQVVAGLTKNVAAGRFGLCAYKERSRLVRLAVGWPSKWRSFRLVTFASSRHTHRDRTLESTSVQQMHDQNRFAALLAGRLAFFGAFARRGTACQRWIIS